MATNFSKEDFNHAILVKWLALANGAAGEPITDSAYGDRTVQVTGTFGSGGTVVIQGSNDGQNWKTLVDPQGNALSFTSTGLELILECPRYTRPNVTAGDGTTSINVYIHGRRVLR